MSAVSCRPQYFKMRGETVLVCKSKKGLYLIKEKNDNLFAPAAEVSGKGDFLRTLKDLMGLLPKGICDPPGFIKMQSFIVQSSYEEDIRVVFYANFQGDDSQIPAFKTADEIMRNCQDKLFCECIEYLEKGGVVYPLEIFVNEGCKVTLPSYTSQEQHKYIEEQQNVILK